jgi:hypothetical protein
VADIIGILGLDPIALGRSSIQIPVLQSATCAPTNLAHRQHSIDLQLETVRLFNIRHWRLCSNTYLLRLTTHLVHRSTVRYVSISNSSLSRASRNQHLKYIQSQRRGIAERKKEQQSCRADSEETKPRRGNWCYCTSLSHLDRGVDNAASLAASQEIWGCHAFVRCADNI